jgi:hypothetical protein
MKEKQILIGILFFCYLLIGTPAIASIVTDRTNPTFNKEITPQIIANKKELLFQVIIDIANNKDLNQLIYVQSTFQQTIAPIPAKKFTRNFLENVYILGKVLSRMINPYTIQRLYNKQTLISEQVLRNNIFKIINKDSNLKKNIEILLERQCDCGIALWNFPIICGILAPIFFIMLIFNALHKIFYIPLLVLHSVGLIFNCFWSSIPIT